MTRDELLALIDTYRDPIYGLLGEHPHPEHPSGNAALYEGHVHYLLGESTKSLVDLFCLLEAAPGLINRKPNSTDEQTHDDYTGLSLSRALSIDFLNYGNNNLGFYDNNNPNMSKWWYLKQVIKSPRYMRFNHFIRPGQRAHYKFGARLTSSVGPLEMLLWSLSIITTALTKDNESGKLLDNLKLYVANRCLRDMSWWQKKLLQFTWTFFYKRVNIKECYRIYFGESHPFYLAAKEL